MQIVMSSVPSKERAFEGIVTVFIFPHLRLNNGTSPNSWKPIRFIPEHWHSIN